MEKCQASDVEGKTNDRFPDCTGFQRCQNSSFMRTFAPAIFLGAFLLFLVQPLIGKYILPWFGGGPGVWTICLLFFQVVLLGGYAYAHLTSRRLKPRAQAALHVALLIAGLGLLPITPSDSWKDRKSTRLNSS